MKNLYRFKKATSRTGNEKGVGLIEACLTIPLIILFLGLIVDAGLYYLYKNQINVASQDALSYASAVDKLDSVDPEDREEEVAKCRRIIKQADTSLGSFFSSFYSDSASISLEDSKCITANPAYDCKSIGCITGYTVSFSADYMNDSSETRRNHLLNNPITVQINGHYNPPFTGVFGNVSKVFKRKFELQEKVAGFREPRFKSSKPAEADCLGIVGGSTTQGCPCLADLNDPTKVQVPEEDYCQCRQTSPISMTPAGRVEPEEKCTCSDPRSYFNTQTLNCDCRDCPAGSTPTITEGSCACECVGDLQLMTIGDTEGCYCPGSKEQTSPGVCECTNSCEGEGHYEGEVPHGDDCQCQCPADKPDKCEALQKCFQKINCSANGLFNDYYDPSTCECTCSIDSVQAESGHCDCINTCEPPQSRDGNSDLDGDNNHCECRGCHEQNTREHECAVAGGTFNTYTCMCEGVCEDAPDCSTDSGSGYLDSETCQCTCAYLEGSITYCAERGQTLDMSICECADCPTGTEICNEACVLSCGDGETLNPETCQCECSPCEDPLFAPDPDNNCNCECAEELCADGSCTAACDASYGQKFDSVTCGCICKETSPRMCTNGMCLKCSGEQNSFDPDTCTCNCPDGKGLCGNSEVCAPKCPGNQALDDSCSCGCSEGQVSCGTTDNCTTACPGGQIPDDSCNCGCDSTTTCTNGEQWDDINCECNCPSSTHEECGGTCYEKCPGVNKVRDPATCQCGCPADYTECNSNCYSDCPGDMVLDPNNGCSCSCETGKDRCGSTNNCAVNNCGDGRALDSDCDCDCSLDCSLYPETVLFKDNSLNQCECKCPNDCGGLGTADPSNNCQCNCNPGTLSCFVQNNCISQSRGDCGDFGSRCSVYGTEICRSPGG